MTEPFWMLSPRDNHLHLFRHVGDVGEALCTHSVPKAELQDPGEHDKPRCVPCLLNWGTELSDRHGDHDRYEP